MKKILLTLFSITILSCGSLLAPSSQVAESTNPNDKFIGTFEFQIFGLPMAGDVILKVTIEDGENGLRSSFDGNGPISDDIIVNETEIEDDILYIDVLIEQQYDVFFELYVEGDVITGYLADQFELEGKRVE
ncbi:MAG: hypothetical protein ACJ0OQ_02085 [Candidatus Marisimplicoccus sp.]|jgi:hypothetical protein|tara:strand:- start:261 stop:656 length:396 start_codon:yes stop_codon:yes gene_type:complete